MAKARYTPRPERIMRCELSGGPLVATVLAAHAPTSGATLKAKEAFCDSLHQEARQAMHPAKMLVFIDANDDDEVKGTEANACFSLKLREAHALLDAAKVAGAVAPT